MKLIRIGSDSSCDIVLHSGYVSALHAEMILHNNGNITIEDKDSRNGTVVGQRKLEPGHPVKVSRGDKIIFADAQLDWGRVPQMSSNQGTVAAYDIGKDYSADIKLTSQYASRFHATLRVDKKKQATIEDNGSRNGTKVNGIVIAKNHPMPIKRGDIVVCADEDITEIVSAYIPDPYKWVKPTVICGSSIIAAVIVALVVLHFIKGPEGPVVVDPNDYRSAVVYVRSHYHFIAHFDDSPIPESIWNGDIDMSEVTGYLVSSQATAFFVDSLGRMATNRHVAVPWEYASSDDIDEQREQIEHFWNSFIGLEPTSMQRNALSEKVLRYVVKAVVASQRKDKSQNALLVEYLQRLLSSKISLKGQLDYIAVGYPGRNYSEEREFDRCEVICESGSKDKDVALLQLNNPRTPSSVKKYFNINNVFVGELTPLKDELYVIGYPNGLEWNLDKNMRSLEPKMTEAKCSRMPSRYDIELDKESVAGASGSPIFNKYGQLVAILYGGMVKGSTGSTLACQARYLQQMYRDELNK